MIIIIFYHDNFSCSINKKIDKTFKNSLCDDLFHQYKFELYFIFLSTNECLQLSNDLRVCVIIWFETYASWKSESSKIIMNFHKDIWGDMSEISTEVRVPTCMTFHWHVSMSQKINESRVKFWCFYKRQICHRYQI